LREEPHIFDLIDLWGNRLFIVISIVG
jgi:hypothetical protein